MKRLKQYPVLFSTPMVNALLRGQKTQTRRIMKDPPGAHENDDGYDSSILARCPYGDVGDILWVRETFMGTAEYGFAYKAQIDENLIAIQKTLEKDFPNEKVKWRPSIFMPKVAARIWLRIEEVSFERLQDISEEDAIQEGVEKIADYGATGYKLYTDSDAAYSDIDACWSFESLWESINGRESWEKNPWVWVIKFSRVEGVELRELKKEAKANKKTLSASTQTK